MDTLKRVHELLEQHNLTLYKLAQVSNVSYSTISTAERRGCQLTVDTIERICDALGISMVEFFAGSCPAPACAESEQPLTADELHILREIISERKQRGVSNAGGSIAKGICQSSGGI